MGETTDPQSLRVDNGSGVNLGDLSTRVDPVYRDKADYQARLQAYADEISDLQARMFANDRHALLVVVQGVDASGKNGLIRRAMRGIDPAGAHVWSFGEPSAAELRQDFLRRYQRRLPLRGHIGVFNRSYYEHVLAVRVHPDWLASRGLDGPEHGSEAFWRQRYEDINAFERYLTGNRVTVLKLMLHLSHDEQRQRFLARLNDPAKAWKLSSADLRDHRQWHAYQKAYAKCLSATATVHAPWYVIPADDKRDARLLGTAILRDTLRELADDWPKPTAARERLLAEAKRELTDRSRAE